MSLPPDIMVKPVVAIIMGSDSDLGVMQDAAKILDEFKISYELTIVSAHRSPDRLFKYARSCPQKGIKVIIAGAGGAAHAPGMVAALTPLPVIGVPIKAKAMEGLDSLLSIVQMPPGIPVATVGVNAAKNAGILATVILGAFDQKIQKKVLEFKKKLSDEVLKKAEKLEKIKYQQYLQDESNKNS
jgi:5-(carboxyamino)imidazole ribonucleotide mutase